MPPAQYSSALLRSAQLLCLLVTFTSSVSATTNRRAVSHYTSDAEVDRVHHLPGWGKLHFGLFSGYITVSEKNERAFFYVFAEAQKVDPATAPVVLWLNGGPGCSSLGGGFLSELGPFYPRKDGYSLEPNPFAWNHNANIIFLESPAFVGFSYSNTSSDIKTGDAQTAVDNHSFLKGFFKRFPQLASNPFWITGESYAGHYLPQLAYEIVSDPNNTIPFEGFMLGNPLTDPYMDSAGAISSWWVHGLISDQSFMGASQSCNFSVIYPLARQHQQTSAGTLTKVDSEDCDAFIVQAESELGDINIYNIYQDICTSKHSAAYIAQMAKLTSHQPQFLTWRHAARQLANKRSKDAQDKASLNAESELTNGATGEPSDEEKAEQGMGGERKAGKGLDTWSAARPQGPILRYNRAGKKGQSAANGSGKQGVQDGSESLVSRVWRGVAALVKRGGLLPGLDAERRQRGRHNRGSDKGKVPTVDPCVDREVSTYLNWRAVQKALHANTTGAVPGPWADCNEGLKYSVEDVMTSMMPLYPKLIEAGLKIIIYSGDVDGILPTFGTRTWVRSLGLKVVSTWSPWTDSSGQPGGWSEVYEKNVAIVTVRNAGHMVPYTQPRRAHDLFQCIVGGDKPTAGPTAVRTWWAEPSSAVERK